MTTQTMPCPPTDTTRALEATNASYTSAGGDHPLIGLTIGQALDRIAALHADRDAVVSIPEDVRFTWSEFNRVVDRAAKALIALDIAKGDRVAIWSTNNYEWVVAQYATAKIGAVLVNVNPAYRVHELEYVLRESQAKVLILIESFKTSNYLEMFYEACPEAKACDPGSIDSWRFPHLRSVIFIGSTQHPGMFTLRSFVELADDAPGDALAARRAELDADDVVNIQYTSGTTGFPKGVMLTHHNILNNAAELGRVMGLDAEDRLCVPVPFYHCFGMVVSNLCAMTVGAAVIIPSPAFDPRATLAAVEQERCTVLHGVPTMFIAELDHPDFDSFDLSTLRTGLMAGAPCPAELMRKVIDRMHMTGIRIAYGMTETSPVATITDPDDPLDIRVETVGRVMPLQEIKIIDPATGLTVPRREAGEICFRGYHLMRGYDNMPDATAETIDEQGWLHSGDIGTMDDDGSIRITGRLKEMVIRGGENIYPREIDEFLYGLDVVRDAAVVGVPDEKYGEELLACIVLNDGVEPPTAEEFRAMCKGQIAHMKIPRYWVIADELPMTVSGKIQKFKIREMAVREGLTEG
jgi:fatty-acyl-CoA synthase